MFVVFWISEFHDPAIRNLFAPFWLIGACFQVQDACQTASEHSGARNTMVETACWTIGTASKVKRAPSGTRSSYKIEELYNIIEL